MPQPAAMGKKLIVVFAHLSFDTENPGRGVAMERTGVGSDRVGADGGRPS